MFTLIFQSLSESSSEEACSVLLPVLATVVMRRAKKAVVCVAALILVHRDQTSITPEPLHRVTPRVGSGA